MRREKLQKGCILLLSLGLGFFLFKAPQLCAQSVRDGIALCGNVVIPALFLFLVLADFWLDSGLSLWLGKFSAPLTRAVFALSPEAASVIFMSMVGGFPVGISMTARLYRDGRISQDEAQRMCMFCFNSGPAFVLFAVGLALLRSLRAGILLFVSCVLSALLLGFCTRFFREKDSLRLHTSPTVYIAPKPAIALTNAVAQASGTMLSICAWVILFYTLTACLQTLPLPPAVTLFLNCILEVTVGLKAAVGHFPLPVFAALLSFGGISVHCQILSALHTCEVPYKHFLLGRIVSALLSCGICMVLLKRFPCEITVFANQTEILPVAYSVSAPAFLSMLFLSILLILELDRGREVC